MDGYQVIKPLISLINQRTMGAADPVNGHVMQRHRAPLWSLPPHSPCSLERQVNPDEASAAASLTVFSFQIEEELAPSTPRQCF